MDSIELEDNVIKWNGLELQVKDFKHSHVNGGRLGKIWVEDRKSGRVFMIKGCSGLTYEPFSEKLAYIIGKNLGIDVLEYDIIPAKYFKDFIAVRNPLCRYVSICEKIDKKNYSITSVAEIKRAKNALLESGDTKITNKEVMYDILPQSYIDTMFLFDAIIGNVDRHYGNVHLLRNTDGEIVGAPIGASLLATTPIIFMILTRYKSGKLFNKSFTTDRTHDEQMKRVQSLTNISFNIPAKTISILNEIQPTLDLMPKLRARIVKSYIVFRLHKYLGMIKYPDIKEYFKSLNHKKKPNFEKEYT